MHGSVLASFRNYISDRYGRQVWETIVQQSGASTSLYVPARIYPDSEALALFENAAHHAGISSKQIQEQFGEHLAPAFLKLYGAMMPAAWTTLDIAENSATVVHRVIRMRYPEAGPPKWSAVRESPNQVRILYASSRGMCGLFIGAMRGFATSRADNVEVTEPRCRHHGDQICEILLRKP